MLGNCIIIKLVPILSTLMNPSQIMPTVCTQSLMSNHTDKVVLSSVQTQVVISVDLLIVLFEILCFSDGFKLFKELSFFKIGWISLMLPSFIFSLKVLSLLSLVFFFSSCFFLSYYLPFSSFSFNDAEQNGYKSKVNPKSMGLVIFVFVALVPLSSLAYFQKNLTFWTIK